MVVSIALLTVLLSLSLLSFSCPYVSFSARLSDVVGKDKGVADSRFNCLFEPGLCEARITDFRKCTFFLRGIPLKVFSIFSSIF